MSTVERTAFIGSFTDGIKLVKTYDIDTDAKTVINKKKNELASGVFRVTYFPSVNSMYLFARGRRGKILSPEAHEIRNNAHLQMSLTNSRDAVPPDCSLTLELGYYLVSSIERRDLDNMLKFIIDTLSEYYQFNDNRVYDIHCYKRNLCDSNEELLFYRILKSDIPDNKMYVSLSEWLLK